MTSHSQEMEFMDIDGPEFLLSLNNEIANIRAGSYQRNDSINANIFDNTLGPLGLDSYNEICVLDTNFLISKLGYLDTVLNLAEENPGSLLVVLPWVVIRELDGLKSANHQISKETEIGLRARKAMRFLEERLRDKSISLRGQKMNEVLDPTMSKNHSVKGDDRILDCCMYFQQAGGKRVSLLSNDRNLCIKVMVHDVDSISSESTPKMESLLNRVALNGNIGKKREDVYSNNSVRSSTRPIKPSRAVEKPKEVEDYVMEIDEFYPHQQEHRIEEDYDMMVDDDELQWPSQTQQFTQGTSDSKWAKAQNSTYGNRRRGSSPTLAYLDDDPTLVAPKKPPQENLIYSNSNHNSIRKDGSWQSIYTP